MKVLLASHSSGLVGGSERSLLEIARYLIREKSVEVATVLPGSGQLKNQLSALDAKTEIIPYWWAENASPSRPEDINKSLARIRRICKYMQKEQPDVVMTNTVVIPWFAYASKLLDIPHVWFIREIIEEGGQLSIYPDVRRAAAFINDYSDHILVNSNHMRGYYSKLLGKDAASISVAYPAFDPAILKYGIKPAPRAAGGPVRLIVFSSLSPNKNQLEVLKAAKLLNGHGVNFNLTIMGAVGYPGYKEKLIKFVNENGLTSKVAFRGHNNDPYPIVSKYDICIVPSVNEPFGRVSVEAMLLGNVVVASDMGGNKEVAQGAKGAFLYKSGDPEALASKLGELIEDPESLGALGREARNYAVKKFLDHDSLESVYDALKQTAGKPKKSRVNDWISDELLDLAEESMELKAKVASLKNSSSQQAKTIADLKVRLGHYETQIDLIVSSKRWQLTSAALKPLDKARKRKGA